MFRELELPPEDRKRLWQKYRSLYYEVHDIQERFRAMTSMNSGQLESRINAAICMAESVKDENGMHAAAAEKERIFMVFKRSVLSTYDRECCWELFSRLREKLESKRNGLQSDRHLEAKKLADDCLDNASRGNPHEALKGIKNAQMAVSGAYMSREQQKLIREELNLAWDRAMTRIEEAGENKQRIREIRRNRMQDNLGRWKENIKKTEDSIRRLEAGLNELKEREGSARTNSEMERIRGYILEAKQKIDARQASIREWRRKIENVETRLNRMKPTHAGQADTH
jgi:hypothetical protein